MTKKQREQYERRYAIEGYATPGGLPARQMAHRIANTKTNRRAYGSDVVDSYINLVPVATLQENARYNIGNRPELCKRIAELAKSGESRLTVAEIDEFLKKTLDNTEKN